MGCTAGKGSKLQLKLKIRATAEQRRKKEWVFHQEMQKAMALTICSTDHHTPVSEFSHETQPSPLHQCIKLGVEA